jgi:hypothetical protein
MFFSEEMGIPFTDLKRRSLGANGKTVCLPLPQKIIRLRVSPRTTLFSKTGSKQDFFDADERR